MRFGFRISGLSHAPILVAVSSLAACGSIPKTVYLHDAALKEKTDQVAEAFDALSEQTGFFDAAGSAFAEAGEIRMESRRDRLDAIHKFGLALLIADHDSNNPVHIKERAAEYVRRELSDIAVPPDWADRAAALLVHEFGLGRGLAAMEERYAIYLRLAPSDEALSGECNEETEEVDVTDAVSASYNLFIDECKKVLQHKTRLAEARGTLFHSEYRDEATKLEETISVAEMVRKNLKREIKVIRQAADRPQSSDSAKQALRELEALLRRLDDLDLVPDEIAGIDLTEIASPIDKRLVALAARAEALGDELKTVLDAVSNPESTPESAQVRRAKEVYQYLLRTSAALSNLDPATTGDLPTPLVGLLISEHYKKLEQTNARQIAHYKQKLALLEAQAEAEEARRRYLFEAADLIDSLTSSCQQTGFAGYLEDCNDESRVARILIALDLAHTEGVLPIKLAGEAIVNLTRVEGLARSRANYDHVIAVASPAIDAIQAYGDGGITAETVARVVNGLALLAIAVGVN